MSSTNEILSQLASIGLRPIGPGEIAPDRAAAVGAPSDAFADIVDAVNAKSVIEVGSWEGRSAIIWGQLLSARATDWLLVCIDTWLGSTEMWHRADGDWSREKLRLNDGYPTVFATFTSTIRRAGLETNTVALPIDSAQGIEILRQQEVHADIVYVDAAHDFTNALRDIRHAHELINAENPRSLVLCDDFMQLWAGVREAVFAIAHETGARILVKQSQAALVPASAGESMIDELVAVGWSEARPETTENEVAHGDETVARLTSELREAYIIISKANFDLRDQRIELREVKASRRELRERIREMRKANSPATGDRGEELKTVKAELANVLNSRSWRMTAGLRKLRALVRRRGPQ